MSYIGSKPADAVLETDDITDGVITTSKLADNSVTTAKTSYFDAPFRNIIINGDYSIFQRGDTVTGVTDQVYSAPDRWKTQIFSTAVFTISKSTDVPSGQGFASSCKWDCTTANASPSATTFMIHEQRIEGQNIQYLEYGTSSAKSLTASFWVKSNKTGAYTVGLYSVDGSRHIESSYTISTANTWEKKIITFAGDTAGTINNDNGEGLRLWFHLGAGSNWSSGTHATTWSDYAQADVLVDNQVNLADSTSNEWLVTGVQLEAGTTPSDFEFLPYDVNLRRCYRYYWGWWDKADAGVNATAGGLAVMYTSAILYVSGFFPVTMRATPSLDQASGTNYYTFYRNGAADNFDDFTLQGSGRTNKNGYEMNNSTDISGTAGQAGFIRCNNVNAYIFFDAEL